jgi:hypothetical protein
LLAVRAVLRMADLSACATGLSLSSVGTRGGGSTGGRVRWPTCAGEYLCRSHITNKIPARALVEAIHHVPVGHPCASARTISSPATARRPRTSQGGYGPATAHLGLLRDARRPGPCPGHRHPGGCVCRPGHRQHVIAGSTGHRQATVGRLV